MRWMPWNGLRGRRFRQMALGGLCLALLAAGGVWLWLVWRPAYDGPLEALLPPDCPTVIRLRNLAAGIAQLEGARAFDEVFSNVDLSVLLVEEEDWSEFVEQRDSPAMQARLRVGRAFLRRYFSADALVAFAPSRLRPERPALLGLTRADTGFLEAMAELVAAFYPDSRLVIERHRGVSIHRYVAGKERHGFAYIRLGKTVALSLRSSEGDYLREVIDRFRDGEADAGAATESASSSTVAGADGRLADVEITARPLEAFRAWQAVYPEKAESELTADQTAYIESYLSLFDGLRATLTMNGRAELRLEAAYSDEASAAAGRLFPPVQADGVAPTLLPEDTALVLGLCHREPFWIVDVLWDHWSRWPPTPPKDERERRRQERDAEKGRRRQEQWQGWFQMAQSALQVEAQTQIAPFLGQDGWLAVTAVRASLLAPLPELVFLAPGMAAAPPALDAWPQGVATAQTPFGKAELAMADDRMLRFLLGEGAGQALERTRQGETPALSAWPVWQRLATGGEDLATAMVTVYCDFKGLRESLRSVEQSATFWDSDTREDLAETATWIGALSVFHGALLTVHPQDEGLVARLRFLLD